MRMPDSKKVVSDALELFTGDQPARPDAEVGVLVLARCVVRLMRRFGNLRFSLWVALASLITPYTEHPCHDLMACPLLAQVVIV